MIVIVIVIIIVIVIVVIIIITIIIIIIIIIVIIIIIIIILEGGGDRPWPSRSNVTWKSNFIPFWFCPHDDLSHIQARITKFGPEMHLSTVKIPIDVGVDKPSASISCLIAKAIFLTNLFCFFVSHIVKPSL